MTYVYKFEGVNAQSNWVYKRLSNLGSLEAGLNEYNSRESVIEANNPVHDISYYNLDITRIREESDVNTELGTSLMLEYFDSTEGNTSG